MDGIPAPGPSISGPFDQATASRQAEHRFDEDRHVSALAEIGLSDEQARELYAVLETIARGFVEFGWSGEVCGQLLDGFQAVLSNATEPVESTGTNNEEQGRQTS